MIRPATHDDIRPIVRLGCRFAAERRKRQTLPVRDEVVASTAAQFIAAPEAGVFVHEDDGEVDGVIAVSLYDHPFSGEKTAFEVFWWVAPDDPNASGHRSMALLEHASEWARGHGATMVQLHAPVGSRIGPLFDRMGYHEVETAYQGRLHG